MPQDKSLQKIGIESCRRGSQANAVFVSLFGDNSGSLARAFLRQGPQDQAQRSCSLVVALSSPCKPVRLVCL